MILNDIWGRFCKEIQSTENSDYDRKIKSINMANELLLYRWMQSLESDSWPKEFLSLPTNCENTAYKNFVSLPSDFVKINNVWYKSNGNASDTITYTAVLGTFAVSDVITGSISGGIATITAISGSTLTVDFSTETSYFVTGETISADSGAKTGTITAVTQNNYIPINSSQFRQWDSFIQATQTLLFNPSTTSTQLSYVSVNNDRLYFDRYLQSASKNFVKITYWRKPSEIYLLDKATITLLTGTLTGTYAIVGQTSAQEANIDSVSGTYLYVETDTKTGDFTIGETLTVTDSTGATIGTATLTAYDDLYQTLAWADKNKLIFIEACVFCYFKLRQMDEAIQHDVILENMIAMQGMISRNDAFTQMRFSE